MFDTLRDLREQAVQRLVKAHDEVWNKANEEGLTNTDWRPLNDALANQAEAIRHLLNVNAMIADYVRHKESQKAKK